VILVSTDLVGERVADKYELKRLLGSGSMGAVYEGVHVDLGKRLAIKLIHPEFGGSSEALARFRREARAASAVESDYIGQIYDFGRDEVLGLYMVIEYLEGEDLETRLLRERWIGELETATIGLQLARGLAKAHAAGIIHRDLKPANVFLTRRDDGSTLAKILDFGISKFEPEKGKPFAEPTLTVFGTTLGTPQYMSPEPCEGRVDLDARTDVWSLCAVLYEMVAGEPAAGEGGGHIATMQRIVRQNVLPLALRANWVKLELAQTIDAGLVRDRSKRIPDAATLASRLLEALPDAGSRTALSAMTRKTDVSELGPMSEGAPLTLCDPSMLETRVGDPPPNTKPSASEFPPPSGDGVAIFARGDMPEELTAVRANKLKDR
jgi:eukaryotic-like serine/threonine-protein kinase